MKYGSDTPSYFLPLLQGREICNFLLASVPNQWNEVKIIPASPSHFALFNFMFWSMHLPLNMLKPDIFGITCNCRVSITVLLSSISKLEIRKLLTVNTSTDDHMLINPVVTETCQIWFNQRLSIHFLYPTNKETLSLTLWRH